jgi:hypothetical protein
MNMQSYLDLRKVAKDHLATNANSNFYFLIDQAGMPGLHRKLSVSSADWTSLLEGTREGGAVSVAPVLILAGRDGELQMHWRLLEWIGEQGTYTSTLIMLASPLPIDSLRARLASRLEVTLSEDMDALLRFFDPRVFEQLIKILSIEQANALLSPACRWWYVDRAGNLVGMDTEFDIADQCDLPLQLSKDQEFDLIDASEPDQILALLYEHAPSLLSRVPISDQYGFVTGCINSAKELGLSSASDLTLYSAVSLKHGVFFGKSAGWKDVLAEVRLNRISFSEAVAANDVIDP